MGIIRRQAFKNTVFRTFGILVSAIATFFIYSSYKEEYGLYSFLFSGTLVLAPFVSFGGPSICIKFHPNNHDNKKIFSGLLSFLIALLVIGTLSLTLLFFTFRSTIEELVFDQSSDDPLIIKYLVWIIPLTFLVSLRSIFINYISNYQRIVIPELLGNVWNRLSLPVIVFFAGLKFISLETYLILIIISFAISNIGLIIYLLSFEKKALSVPQFIYNRATLKTVVAFATFSIFNSVAGALSVRIDAIMVGKMLDLTNVGAYTILLFLTNIILIPRNSIFQISGPIVARNVDTCNMEEVNRIYKSSSLILLFAGLLISGLILLNIYDLIAILPKSEEFVGFFGVTLFLCLAHTFDMTTSVNTHIIIYSKYYKVNLFMILIMAVANIVFNLYFIPIYGLVGAALSTFLSLLIYNLAKLLFIQRVYQIQPFSMPSLYILLSALILYAAAYLIPSGTTPWLNILWRSVLFGGSFCAIVYYFNWSPQFNQLLKKLQRQIRALL